MRTTCPLRSYILRGSELIHSCVPTSSRARGPSAFGGTVVSTVGMGVNVAVGLGEASTVGVGVGVAVEVAELSPGGGVPVGVASLLPQAPIRKRVIAVRTTPSTGEACLIMLIPVTILLL